MKVILIALIFFSTSLYAQKGYVKFDSGDSIASGYVRQYISHTDGQAGIEVWKTKTDKHPRRFRKSEIVEYAVKHDTFKVLQHYKPFADLDSKIYFEQVEAKLILRGKLDLYQIKNFRRNRNTVLSGGISGSPNIGFIIPDIDPEIGITSSIYILEDRKAGLMRALPSKRKMLDNALQEFFPEKFVLRYSQQKEAIKYNTIPQMVKLYNSK
jgi:hypothetical protein